MVYKIDDLRTIWIPRVLPRSEATDAIMTDVMATLIRGNRRFKNASLRNSRVAKVFDSYPEQTHRRLNPAPQSVWGMNYLTLPIMFKLAAFTTYNVDGAIIVEIVQESI
jgi:hypothetical protein